MKKILLIVLLIISGVSALYYHHFSNKLGIDEISLKKKDNFKITNQVFEFKLNQLKNVDYNLVVKFMTDDNADAVALNKAMYSADKYNLVVQLIDAGGNIAKVAIINDGGKLSSGTSQKYVEWYLAKFSGSVVRGKILKINFQSEDSLFDRLPKELYMVQDYDYASLPWWQLFQRISLISLCISLILSAIVGLILLKRKGSSQ